ncbi:MAG: UDP-N-acetylmuramoyl-L-alanyl-D-glutamate--2,6-diaminopimelate ligase [Oscillospiraceae bacterium]|jgi:UDP-N-acetylmuramoyl-L-alanyl-D-glutamate--2,6-diaminopimelate ligase|nr:UDP-N-acetylmuramoyl-L-alanyl-D-glutamate--2,6-diaminopimelate ligase [Oscillospiraceae bacterium]
MPNVSDYTDITYDSRKVTPGALFVALTDGERDGRGFAADAIKRGAKAVFAADRRTLAELSAEFFGHPECELTLIGVTGTKGKTSVTTYCKQIYETVSGNKAGLIGTIANIVGDVSTPSTLTTPESRDLYALFAEMVKAGCKAVFMEVSSQALAVGRVSGLRFAVGALTNFSHEHLDLHGTMENYLAAKLKLADVSDKFIIDERIKLPSAANNWQLVDGGDNRAIVLAICTALGLDRADCEAAYAEAKPPKGRADLAYCGRFTVMIDYAHSPDSLRYILDYGRKLKPSKLTVVFGCGGDRDRSKRPVMGEIAAKLADYVIVTSDNPRSEDPNAIIDEILSGFPAEPPKAIPDRREAIAYAIKRAIPGELIILAGKGHEPYQEINGERRSFDEYEIINELTAGE